MLDILLVYLFNIIFFCICRHKQKSKTKKVSSVEAKSSFWHFPPALMKLL